MPLTFTLDPAVTPELRDGLLDLWTDVSNAGGAVGYVPPVTREEIRPALVQHFASMAEGRVKLLVGHDEEGRAHRYRPVVERVQARESALERLTRKLFAGSPELLLTHLVSQRKLSEAELRRLRDLVEDQLPEEER